MLLLLPRSAKDDAVHTPAARRDESDLGKPSDVRTKNQREKKTEKKRGQGRKTERKKKTTAPNDHESEEEREKAE